MYHTYALFLYSITYILLYAIAYIPLYDIRVHGLKAIVTVIQNKIHEKRYRITDPFLFQAQLESAMDGRS